MHSRLYLSYYSMKVVIWNVQGSKKAQLQLKVGFINRTIKRDILFLIETMVNEHNSERIIRTLGFHNFDYILPHNHVGRIFILLNDENVELDILAKKQRAVYCSVFEKSTNKRCIVTAVYASAQIHEKCAFWNHLKSLNATVTFPWCTLGDFNEMLHPGEKIGETPLDASKLQRFNDFLTLCQGHDTHVQGQIFTWKNNLHGHLIYENLTELFLERTAFASSRITVSLTSLLHALTILICLLIRALRTLLEKAHISDISILRPSIKTHIE